MKRSLTLDLWELVADAMRKVVDDMRGARGGLGMVTVAMLGMGISGAFLPPRKAVGPGGFKFPGNIPDELSWCQFSDEGSLSKWLISSLSHFKEGEAFL